MAALTGFLRVVGPTLAKPLLTAITPRHVIEIGQSSSSNNPNPVSTTRAPKFESLAKLVESLHVVRVEKNPLKKNGPTLPVSIWEPVGSGFVRVRLDMPGASLVEVVPDPEEKSVKFKGVEQEISMHGIGNNNGVCRTFEGTLLLDPLKFSELDYNYKFFNGVLWFEFRCSNPEASSDLGVTVKPRRKVDAVPEIMEESLYNPLMLHGKDRYCHHDGWFVFAVDMPGIGEHDIMELSVVGNTVYYFVQDKDWRSYGESLNERRREYEGRFKLDGQKYDPKRAQFEISHGVLWIQVPKIAKLPTTSVTLYHGTRRQDLMEGHFQ